jgi:hypothetical protein
VAANFSLDGATELAYASFNVGLAPIRTERLKLFRGAFVAHKSEAKIAPILSEGVEIGDYVEHLLQLAAGIRNPAQANFETNYLTALKSAPKGAVVTYQLRDKEYLESKLA